MAFTDSGPQEIARFFALRNQALSLNERWSAALRFQNLHRICATYFVQTCALSGSMFAITAYILYVVLGLGVR